MNQNPCDQHMLHLPTYQVALTWSRHRNLAMKAIYIPNLVFMWWPCQDQNNISYLDTIYFFLFQLTHHRWVMPYWSTEIILCMSSANERWRYTVMPSFIGWVHTQNDPWVQKMAYCLLNTTPLSEPMLTHCWLSTWEQISTKIKSKYNIFYVRKWIWKCHL